MEPVTDPLRTIEEVLVEGSSQPLVLINAFEVPPDADDDFIRGWEAARDYLQTQPGYVGTALHRAVSPDADFRFIKSDAGSRCSTSRQRFRDRAFARRRKV
jgi:hypothetical protein